MAVRVCLDALYGYSDVGFQTHLFRFDSRKAEGSYEWQIWIWEGDFRKASPDGKHGVPA